MVMRKRTAAQADLSSIQNSESPKTNTEDTKKPSPVGDKKVIATRRMPV